MNIEKFSINYPKTRQQDGISVKLGVGVFVGIVLYLQLLLLIFGN